MSLPFAHRRNDSTQREPLLEDGGKTGTILQSRQHPILAKIRKTRGAIALLLLALLLGPLLFLASRRVNTSSSEETHKEALTSAWTTLEAPAVSLPHTYEGPYTQNEVNSTFGFEKVLVLNLPHRQDKKDEMVMMGAVSGVNLTFIETKTMDQIKESGLPWHGSLSHGGAIGVFRAHADAWQRVLTEDWNTALILEDDSDWDVDFKYALQQLHQPLAALIRSIENPDRNIVSTKQDPWVSSEWDVLNLGLCLENPFHAGDKLSPLVKDVNKPPYIMYEDKTMPFQSPMAENLISYYDYYNQSWPKVDDPPTTRAPRRMVTLSHQPVCMNAYAVSRSGALKLLYHSTRGLYAPIDNIMADLCAEDKLRSYEVIPQVMGQWKPDDSGAKSSDNWIGGADKAALEKFKQEQLQNEADTSKNHNPSIGASTNIRNSIRAAMPKLLTGRKNSY